MIINESTPDRFIRVVVGAVALVAAVMLGVGTAGGILLLALGGILVVTGAVGFCPLYRLLGVSTVRASRK